MQIYISATTATTVGHGDPIRTGNTGTANAQVLPAWAPDIEYIPTTTLVGIDAGAMAYIYGPTTAGVVAGEEAKVQQCVVRNWDARHFCLPMHIWNTPVTAGGAVPHPVYHAAKGDAIICLTYRAVGELSR